MKKPPLIAAAGAIALAGAFAAYTADQWLPSLRPAPEAAAVLAPVGPTGSEAAVAPEKGPEQIVTLEAPAAVSPPAKVEEQNAEAPPPAPAEETKIGAASDPLDTLTPPIPELEAKPQFDTVRVEVSGEAVIAGTAKPGAEVEVKLNGETVGAATANADGAFVVIPEKPLPAGAGALTLAAKSNSGVINSEDAVAVAVPEKKAVPATEEAPPEAMVALVKPAEPVKIIQTPAVTAKGALTLDSIDYSDAGDILFKGKAKPGSILRLYANNAFLGEVKGNAEGGWFFDGRNSVAPGTYSLRVDELTTAGAVAQRLELPFTREDPELVTASLKAAPDTGVEVKGPSLEDGLKDAALAALPTDGRIVIQPGNNLWKLSRVIYGKGTAYTVIYEANKGSIRDPDMIYPGQIFMVPGASPPETIDPARIDPLTVDEGGSTPK